ncbi:uncharacterized protein LY89DRAFT_368386 [Mollisia scopiformis]|uniref:Uncharacterized protein n=1 Tax=Mollisia scopiformis TaxID=149040 RepID=A0A132B3X1_MOLSC|nr:uncharacterized protein LY89DRAFT_368386 [Mollisia scopiformis]KUJ07108.1 hypothetical protein LY89DRAFT_368386 [Mollisia scopiformis]
MGPACPTLLTLSHSPQYPSSPETSCPTTPTLTYSFDFRPLIQHPLHNSHPPIIVNTSCIITNTTLTKLISSNPLPPTPSSQPTHFPTRTSHTNLSQSPNTATRLTPPRQ